jgi:hypothetical protein
MTRQQRQRARRRALGVCEACGRAPRQRSRTLCRPCGVARSERRKARQEAA